MNPDRPVEKVRPDLGERQGSVIEVNPDSYLVELYTPMGWRIYKFPKNISKDVLKKENLVRVYVVEIAGKCESRLEKIPEKVLTKEEEREMEQKFAEFAEERMKKLEEL